MSLGGVIRFAVVRAATREARAAPLVLAHRHPETSHQEVGRSYPAVFGYCCTGPAGS